VSPPHGSRPDLGVDAIAKAGAFLAGLDRLASDLGARPGLCARNSVHPADLLLHR
jgi:acetylornithine deacetylase